MCACEVGGWFGVCNLYDINDVVVTPLCVCICMCNSGTQLCLHLYVSVHVCDCVRLHTYGTCLHDFACVCSYSPLVGEVSIKISSTTLNLISSSMSINMSCFSSPASYSHTHSCSFWSLWQQHMLSQGNSIKHQLELWCCYIIGVLQTLGRAN